MNEMARIRYQLVAALNGVMSASTHVAALNREYDLGIQSNCDRMLRRVYIILFNHLSSIDQAQAQALEGDDDDDSSL